jgi:DnaJ-class molecular chaperone
MELATCNECRGKGSVRCPDCHGKGKKDYGTFLTTDWRECRLCHGSGRKKCGVCNGRELFELAANIGTSPRSFFTRSRCFDCVCVPVVCSTVKEIN